MKTVLIIFSLLFLSSLSANAQPRFGVQIGGSLASVDLGHKYGTVGSKTEKISSDPRAGLVFGVSGEFYLGNFINFRPELNLAQKGYHLDKHGLDPVQDTRLNYLEIPLNICFNIPSTRKHLFVATGPVVSMGLSGKIRESDLFERPIGDVETIKIKFDGEQPVSDKYRHLKQMEFSVDAMIGYNFCNNFFATCSYTAGLTDNLPKKDEHASWKNSMIAFKAGYYFAGKKKLIR